MKYTHSETDIIEIIRRFKVNKEIAMTAPKGVLIYLPEVPIKLSEEDKKWVKEVGERWLLAKESK